jgi:hypothetical protein
MIAMAEALRTVHITLSATSADALKAICTEHGITMTGFMEATVRRVAKSLTGTFDDHPYGGDGSNRASLDMMREARDIDTERRSRRSADLAVVEETS